MITALSPNLPKGPAQTTDPRTLHSPGTSRYSPDFIRTDKAQKDLLPPEPFPMNGVDMNGEAAGTLFFLFLSAFGFFFSRLLRN
jgi:hypothetical protein